MSDIESIQYVEQCLIKIITNTKMQLHHHYHQREVTLPECNKLISKAAISISKDYKENLYKCET